MYVPAVTSTVTMLDVSNNHLLPEGIKHVCTALRTCTAMRELDLSYNSPGRGGVAPAAAEAGGGTRSAVRCSARAASAGARADPRHGLR